MSLIQNWHGVAPCTGWGHTGKQHESLNTEHTGKSASSPCTPMSCCQYPPATVNINSQNGVYHQHRNCLGCAQAPAGYAWVQKDPTHDGRSEGRASTNNHKQAAGLVQCLCLLMPLASEPGRSRGVCRCPSCLGGNRWAEAKQERCEQRLWQAHQVLKIHGREVYSTCGEQQRMAWQGYAGFQISTALGLQVCMKQFPNLRTRSCHCSPPATKPSAALSNIEETSRVPLGANPTNSRLLTRV